MIVYGLPIHHKVLSEKMWKVVEPLIGNLAFQAWGTSDLHAQAGRKKNNALKEFPPQGHYCIECITYLCNAYVR